MTKREADITIDILREHPDGLTASELASKAAGQMRYGPDFVMQLRGHLAAQGRSLWCRRVDSSLVKRYALQPGSDAGWHLAGRHSKVTLELTDAEAKAVEELMRSQGLTIQQVYRQALHLYQAEKLGAVRVTHPVGDGCTGD